MEIRPAFPQSDRTAGASNADPIQVYVEAAGRAESDRLERDIMALSPVGVDVRAALRIERRYGMPDRVVEVCP